MAKAFAALDRKYGLPEGLIDAVWMAETSRGRNNRSSSAGARENFQFMPATRDEVLKQSGFDAYAQPKNNSPEAVRDALNEQAEAAGYYLQRLHRQTGGDIAKTLAAYNWGIGNVQNKGLGRRPAETLNYTHKILEELGIDQLRDEVAEYAARPRGVALSEEQQRTDQQREAQRRGLLGAFGMEQEKIDALSGEDVLGSFFLLLLTTVVSSFVRDHGPEAALDVAQEYNARRTQTPSTQPTAPVTSPPVKNLSLAQVLTQQQPMQVSPADDPTPPMRTPVTERNPTRGQG